MKYKYLIKETSQEIISPHKNKFINTVSPWMVGSFPVTATKDINVYYLLLDYNTIAPDGEALLLTFDRNDAHIESAIYDEGLN